MISYFKKHFSIKFDQWYLEYKNSIRLHFYFNFMINMYPVLVVCRFDSPHTKKQQKTIIVQFLMIEYKR